MSINSSDAYKLNHKMEEVFDEAFNDTKNAATRSGHSANFLWKKLESMVPTWESAVIMAKKEGVYISLTEECQFDQVMPWKDFEKAILDPEECRLWLSKLKKILPKLEKMVRDFPEVRKEDLVP